MKNLLFFAFVTYGVRRVLGKVVALVLIGHTAFAEEQVTILAVGDSLTQGYGLIQEQGFVPQLNRWLEDQGAEVNLINAGVSGDTTAGGAARVEWSLTPDVDAMIVALGGNDLLRGLDPSEARKNISKILQVAQARELPVLLVGIEAPRNYGPEYKQAFDAIYPDLSAQFGTLYFKSFFDGLGDGGPAALQPFFQADGIHPNAEGVGKIVAAMGPRVVELIERAADK
ncbi:MAG: arylesterase [Pseudomonadota bacterium]